MAQLGGFFAVVYVSERAIHDGLDAAWRVGWDKVRQPVAWAAPTPRGQVVALGVLAPDRPSVSFDSALNGVRVALSAGARVSISVGAEKPRDAFVELRTNLAAPIRLTQEQVSTPAWVDLSSLTIEPVNVGVTWVDGTRDPLVEAALNSPEVRREMAAQLREALAPLLTVRLPMDKAWLAQLALTYQGVPGSALYLPMVQLGGVRILDGWLAVGIDATADTAQTKGDVNGIGAPPDAPPPAAKPPLVLEDLGDQSLRVLLDPVPLKKYLEKNAEFALRMAAAQRPGIRPRPEFSIDFDNDAVVLHASGTVNAPNPFPGAAFFAAAIRLTPFIPKNTQTVYAHIKPNITVDAPWYLEVLGAIIDFFGGDAFAKLKRANKSELAILFPLVYSHSAPEFVAGVRGTRIVMRPRSRRDLWGGTYREQCLRARGGPSRAHLPVHRHPPSPSRFRAHALSALARPELPRAVPHPRGLIGRGDRVWTGVVGLVRAVRRRGGHVGRTERARDELPRRPRDASTPRHHRRGLHRAGGRAGSLRPGTSLRPLAQEALLQRGRAG